DRVLELQYRVLVVAPLRGDQPEAEVGLGRRRVEVGRLCEDASRLVVPVEVVVGDAEVVEDLEGLRREMVDPLEERGRRLVLLELRKANGEREEPPRVRRRAVDGAGDLGRGGLGPV